MKEFSKCEHHVCGFENRLEYCGIEAKNPKGLASLVSEVIDVLLYESHDVSSHEYRLSASHTGRELQRTFVMFSEGTEQNDWAITETHVAIRHEQITSPHAQSYQVEVAWQDNSPRSSWVMTAYEIDIYDNGYIEGQVKEHGLNTIAMNTRRMTDYDYELLFDELAGLCETHNQEVANKYTAESSF